MLKILNAKLLKTCRKQDQKKMISVKEKEIRKKEGR